MSAIRARTRTPWTDAELIAAYAEAARQVLAEDLPRPALAVLWGQACLETGRGGAACWCWNVGNVRASELEPHTILAGAYEFAAPDRVPAGATIIPAPAGSAPPPGTVCYLMPAGLQRFRAYDSLVDGCAGKLGLVRRRWPKALDALRLATGYEAAVAYVSELRGYFTGNARVYAGSVASLAREILARQSVWEGLEPAPAAPTERRPTTWDERPIEIPSASDFVGTLASAGDGNGSGER